MDDGDDDIDPLKSIRFVNSLLVYLTLNTGFKLNASFHTLFLFSSPLLSSLPLIPTCLPVYMLDINNVDTYHLALALQVMISQILNAI